MADWNAIRQEYITDESSSYRKLAQKYGISYTAIGDKARKEGWADQRSQFLNKTLSKTINAIGNSPLCKMPLLKLPYKELTINYLFLASIVTKSPTQ